MKIGLQFAMPAEFHALPGAKELEAFETVSGVPFYEAAPGIIACAGGVSKVNAAMAAEILCLKYGVDMIVNAGVAGCLTGGHRRLVCCPQRPGNLHPGHVPPSADRDGGRRNRPGVPAEQCALRGGQICVGSSVPGGPDGGVFRFRPRYGGSGRSGTPTGAGFTEGDALSGANRAAPAT